MKCGKVLLAVLLVFVSLACNNDVTSVIPVGLKPIDNYSKDARIIAARLSNSAWIDVTLAAEIDSALAVARRANPFLVSVHTMSDFVLDELEVEVKKDAGVQWVAGNLLTGDEYLDSLGKAYNLISVQPFSDSAFLIKFRQSLNIPALATLYLQSPKVVYAVPNAIVGDGNHIWALKKSGDWDIVFSQGIGDCPSGCIYRDFFYVTVSLSEEVSQIVEVLQSTSPPRIYRWNIPPSFPATIFIDDQDLLDHYQSSIWWERRHAIEVTWRLFENSSPWYVYDEANIARWRAIKTNLAGRKTEVVSLLLQLRLNDSDEDVRASAALALGMIAGTQL